MFPIIGIRISHDLLKRIIKPVNHPINSVPSRAVVPVIVPTNIPASCSSRLWERTRNGVFQVTNENAQKDPKDVESTSQKHCFFFIILFKELRSDPCWGCTLSFASHLPLSGSFAESSKMTDIINIGAAEKKKPARQP